MTALRRTALASVFAAAALLGIKLVTGLASGSLAFIAEALHSGTDLVAALLTFYAVGFAGKPADRSHQYGHGKAEHLAALGEAAVLALVSLGVAALAVARLAGWLETDVQAAWWAFAAAGGVVAIDLSRTVVSYRSARRYSSAALFSNALHFGSDLVGTVAVLLGLVAVRAGWPAGDSIAALFVALIVVLAASRLMARNVDVLMDRAPADVVEAARVAIDALDPPVALRRLRLRQAAGRTFADVVIGVSPGAAVGQGHAAADRVEDAVHRVVPGADVVVHVEPIAEEVVLLERVRAAAMNVGHVREVHNLALVDTGDGVVASLHLKLPGGLHLDAAHALADRVEREIVAAVPEITGVQTHIEPLAEEASGSIVAGEGHAIGDVVREQTGEDARELRFLHTEEGIVVFLTLAIAPDATVAAAHEQATRVEGAIRAAHPEVADVIVHTEP